MTYTLSPQTKTLTIPTPKGACIVFDYKFSFMGVGLVYERLVGQSLDTNTIGAKHGIFEFDTPTIPNNWREQIERWFVEDHLHRRSVSSLVEYATYDLIISDAREVNPLLVDISRSFTMVHCSSNRLIREPLKLNIPTVTKEQYRSPF